ncbi:2-succinyl-6-hydroxy-2,4-cyclohexadiene-1-carboxylate synthase [Gynuella sunshinyii YC6258]|uniref:2-succinyl-5-enolpyruvyl-6-hydroxy-3-cyclohexene-1-carboxylate synthase n=2 Tax=Gynuella sunshinyii TaxID=1445505 RepID=A0A0C5VCT6_9GAMM|nr:2-succinyl-6-hydroxy-2,4-cyclohexadiene-1-carboxylate synthase [Gynuella sunshinyii YC6258]
MYHLGVRHFCVAPGSRNAAFSLALFRLSRELDGLNLHTHFDERGLGFLALGLARVQQQPVCIVTTSGTAVANLHPAVVEAFETLVPLFILSADRPDRLLECGANQAIRQKHMFGANARLSVNLSCPADSQALHQQISGFLQQYAQLSLPGPIQLNCQFDEPLYEQVPPLPLDWLRLNPVTCATPAQSIDETLLDIIRSSRSTLILLGQLTPLQHRQLLPWISRLRCPVIADIASQFRGCDEVHLLHYGDLLLAHPAFVAQLQPDLVIQFGGRIVSKRVGQFLEQYLRAPEAQYLLLSEYDQPLDPTRRARQQTISFERVAEWLPSPSVHPNLQLLIRQHQQLAEALPDLVDGSWHEAAVARLLMCHMPAGSAIMAGNSLSIRMLDSYGRFAERDIHVYSSRGASGIDGLVATAAALTSAYQHSYLLVGDTALLHDLNSLALLAKMPAAITIVVLNNNGGGIFDLLPASQQTAYEQMFLMPHGLAFQHAAAQFELDYELVADLPGLQKLLTVSGNPKRSRLIECRIHEGTTRLKGFIEQIRQLPAISACL